MSRPAPGAARSTSRPWLDDGAIESSSRLDATTSVSRRFFGLWNTTSSPLLPAEVTTTVPSACASSTASSITGFTGQRTLQLQLLFITSAPFCAAYTIPCASADESPEPCAGKPFSAITRASGATPRMPMPLAPRAAAVPETWVPWPASSKGSASLLKKS